MASKRIRNYTPTQLAARRAYNREWRRRWRANPANREHDRLASRKQHAAIRADPVKRARFNAQCNERNYVKKYGITRADKQAMLREQGDACAVCRDKSPTTFRPWHLDHDHKTGRVRGVLCHYCNSAAGAVKDSAVVARRLATYLEGTA